MYVWIPPIYILYDGYSSINNARLRPPVKAKVGMTHQNYQEILDLEKRVYDFTEGNKDMRALLGGKGANLAEMTNLGLTIPPGFTITTKTCETFFEAGGKFPEGLWEEILEHVKTLEKNTGKRLKPI